MKLICSVVHCGWKFNSLHYICKCFFGLLSSHGLVFIGLFPNAFRRPWQIAFGKKIKLTYCGERVFFLSVVRHMKGNHWTGQPQLLSLSDALGIIHHLWNKQSVKKCFWYKLLDEFFCHTCLCIITLGRNSL